MPICADAVRSQLMIRSKKPSERFEMMPALPANKALVRDGYFDRHSGHCRLRRMSGWLLLSQRLTSDCDDIRQLAWGLPRFCRDTLQNLVEELVINAIRRLRLLGLNLFPLGP